MAGQCSKCTSTPVMVFLNQTLYLSVESDHLFEKIQSVLKKLPYEYETIQAYFKIDVSCFKDFMGHLEAQHLLSSVEMKSVYILPVSRGKDISFADFKMTKNLFYWMTLFHNLDIVEAVKNNRIHTLFQPILECKSLEVYGHEALSRATDDKGQPILLSRLFDVSKKLDMMYNLDRQCRLASITNATKQTAFRGKLFINFIPTVIYDPNVCLRTTHEAVVHTGIKPQDIVFEVVESEFVEDYRHLADILDFYRKKGYKTALDDVGSGYSTLSKIDLLKTDYIKIDKDMIRDIHISKPNQMYLDQALEIKKKTGTKIIAEGVETAEEYAYLKGTDVDLVQGYYFARPSADLYVKK